ncbi:RNA 2'-phosphotransferase [Actinocorallia lasiicapitis]
MDEKKVVSVSKYLAKHLRHEPERLGLVLDRAGWTPISDLLTACARAGKPITLDELRHVVAVNDKQRFAISEDGLLIRANQGHSLPIDLALPLAVPPAVLYHGTVAKFLPVILAEGLRPMSRHDVHLSPDTATAHAVGSRRGRPVILTVAAARMHADGHLFRQSANGVWLTPAVPRTYLTTPPHRPRSS